MRYSDPLLSGRLVRRYKRFLADVLLDDGRLVTAHCANPGSMKGLIREGTRVLLSTSPNPDRKLRWTLELLRVGRVWAGVNTARTNAVVAAALARKAIPELAEYPTVRAEVRMGERRRVDFLLSHEDGRRCYLEVKNVTLAENGVARFPDSVTARGTAHLEELVERKRQGDRAVMLYVVNRADCTSAGSAAQIDPLYARTLDLAREQGVEAIAYRARGGRRGIRLEERIPFEDPGRSGA